MTILQKTIKKIPMIDYKCISDAQERLDNLTKPQGSFGRLEEIAKQVCGITRKKNPYLDKKIIFTLAADHGVTEEGVSAYPKDVTEQMVYNFLRGGAGINVLARHIGARVVVVDMGVAGKIRSTKHEARNFREKKINYGTRNFLKEPAMTREEAEESIETGIDIFNNEYKKGIDIVGIGEMGIGNTTASSAITACVTGCVVEEVTGRGTGVSDDGLIKKISVIKRALSLRAPKTDDAIDILSKVGGFEIGGMAGIILAAAAKRVPVMLDGFISGAAALIAYKLEPKSKDYMLASHSSVERGHKVILKYLDLKPILELDLRLGEGTGAALGINLAEASVKIMIEMATFKKAGVSERVEELKS